MSRAQRTPLQKAVKKGNLEEVKLLIANGVPVNDTLPDEKPPLYLASEGGHLEIAQLLLEQGVDITSKGFVPLEIAALRGHLEMVRLLLEKGAEVDSMPNHVTPLRCACRKGHVEVARLLLKHGANVHGIVGKRVGANPLHIAVQMGHLEVARLLLDNGASVHYKTKRSDSPIHHAVRNCHCEMIDLLLDHGADTVYEDLVEGELVVAEHLIRKYPQVAYIDNDKIMRVAMKDNTRSVQVLQYLISTGANVNLRDFCSYTPIYYALRNRCEHKVFLLAANGADLTIPYFFYKGNVKTNSYNTVWSMCSSKSLHEALLHFWTPKTHKFHPACVKNALTCTLLVARRQSWPFDKMLLLKIFTYVAYDWFMQPDDYLKRMAPARMPTPVHHVADTSRRKPRDDRYRERRKAKQTCIYDQNAQTMNN